MSQVYLRSTNGLSITYTNGLVLGPVPFLVDSTNADYQAAIVDTNVEIMHNTEEALQLIRLSQITMKSELMGSNAISGDLVTVPTPGTRVQLPNVPCREVTLIGLINNTGKIYAGSSNVSSTHYGVALQSKDSFTFAVSNADMIYIDADNAGEGISYVAV